jgi:hypothetical protein
VKYYYTKEQRRAYNVARALRLKDHPVPHRDHLCDCGKPATLHRGSEWICPRCKASETPTQRTAIGLVTRHEGNILWDELGIAMRRMLAVPDWMRHWCNRESPAEGNASELMNRITVAIQERDDCIVVDAHGHYVLPLHHATP